jgi:peptide/nickel transport system substrate-binding protein
MHRKPIAVLLLICTLVMSFALAACGSTPAPQANQPQPTTAVQPTVGATTVVEASPVPTEASGPKRGGTLEIGQDFGPQHFDPHKTTAWASVNIYESIYEGLVQWNDDETQLIPKLATSWDISDDGLVYTFKIRQGVKFHNGREMTADDVKFSFDRMRDPNSGSLVAPTFDLVTAVDVVDSETVQITLSKPSAVFLTNLTERNPIVPPEAVDELETKPVGTGPFMLDEYVLDQYVRLVRNPDYYEEGLPYLDGVEFKILGDEASKEAALRSKSVDMTWFRDPRQATALAASEPGIISAPGIPSRYIPIRLNLCMEPFNDVNVRRAFSLAMDREALIATVIPSEYGGAVGTVLAPSSPFFWKGDTMDLPYYRRDVDQAKALLAEAGYPDGIKIDEYKVVAANQLDVDAAQVLKEQWAEAGIDVTILPMEVGQILDDWRTGNGTMVQVGLTWAADPDIRLYNVFHSSAAQAQAYCINDPELDQLLETGRSSVDPDVRMQAYQDVQKLIADQVYELVDYGYPLRWEMWWDYVKGYHDVPSNSRWRLRTTWLDK